MKFKPHTYLEAETKRHTKFGKIRKEGRKERKGKERNERKGKGKGKEKTDYL